jgi:hypothetical protein
MNVLPKSGAAWGRLFLLPFKAYVATSWLVVRFYLREAGRQWNPSDVQPFVLGYMLCFVILLLGGIVQWTCGRRGDCTLSFVAAALAALICWLLPGLAKA